VRKHCYRSPFYDPTDRRIMKAEMVGDFSLPVSVLLDRLDDGLSPILTSHLYAIVCQEGLSMRL